MHAIFLRRQEPGRDPRLPGILMLLERGKQICKAALAHPQLRNLSLDDPLTTERRRGVIQGNAFLRRIYNEWYLALRDRIPQGSGRILELGSGAGFFADYVSDAITSEVLMCSGVKAITDARRLPFRSASLKAIVMIDVFHHISDVRLFLTEAERTLGTGGAILMIEPWVSRWSQLIYTNLHHEPFDPKAETWGFPSSGPLSGANGALPWIVFERDKVVFARDFPSLAIREVRPMMPFRYLVSGGVSMRQLMPKASFPLWTWIDRSLSRWTHSWPMFALIDVVRR